MVVIPSDELLKVFANQALLMLEKVSNNENITLAQFRDTLLPKLISGELRVKDAERFLEAAT